MGATIARLAWQGHNVLLVDATNGEPTPHGSPEIRAKEAADAARILGVSRVSLGLPNRFVQHTIEARHALAGIYRTHRADMIFTPFFHDAHPDHLAVTRIAEDARFDAKLTRINLAGEPIYPRWFFYYYATHLRWVADPSFLIDTTGFEEQKRLAVMAYESQFVVNEKNKNLPDVLASASTYFGSRIGTRSAEPFFTKEPIGLNSLDSLAT